MRKFIAEHTFTVMEKKDFSICKYKAYNPVVLPDGKETTDITVKGLNLPKLKGIAYEFTGSFEEYHNKTTGKVQYTFNLSCYKEILPSKEDAIKEYLLSLKGMSKSAADKLYSTFRKGVFDALEEDASYIASKANLSKKTVEKLQIDFINRSKGHELASYLNSYGIGTSQSAKLYKLYGMDALKIIRENPFILMRTGGVSFKKADYIASKEGFSKNSTARIEAGIEEVLAQSERGGSVFFENYPLPGFVRSNFLAPRIVELIEQKDTYNTGNVYLCRDICYLMTLKLLNIPITEAEFDNILQKMHGEKLIWVDIDRTLKEDNAERIKIYRYATAKAEMSAAKKLAEFMTYPLPKCDKLKETIYQVQKNLNILLNEDQQKGVETAMQNPVSIITGGPGTGKTSVQKTLIETFKAYYPEEGILLAAPTGRAAKRMSESTGYPAATLHKALMLYADDDGMPISSSDGFLFSEKLIIIDETSMIGSLLLEKLVEHVKEGTRLVFVGDIHQLPSVEVGAVLRELINSKVIPVTELTKTYRQSSGSSIITNAARIKAGQQKLEINQEFQFLADETSETISDTVCSVVPRLYEEYGEDEVMCLTSYRRSTASGADALNEALRECLRTDITKDTPYFEKTGEKRTKIYEGDRIMNTKNTDRLTNGDIGKVISITKKKDSTSVVCEFEGEKITLEDNELQSLELAYATTVHKSQGSEAKAVVLVVDIAHARSLKRNLFYTGVTRAKQRIYVVGQPYALNKAIREQDSVYRKSQLGHLLNRYSSYSSTKNGKKHKKNKTA